MNEITSAVVVVVVVVVWIQSTQIRLSSTSRGWFRRTNQSLLRSTLPKSPFPYYLDIPSESDERE
jgi:hypothetical protein